MQNNNHNINLQQYQQQILQLQQAQQAQQQQNVNNHNGNNNNNNMIQGQMNNMAAIQQQQRQQQQQFNSLQQQFNQFNAQQNNQQNNGQQQQNGMQQNGMQQGQLSPQQMQQQAIQNAQRMQQLQQNGMQQNGQQAQQMINQNQNGMQQNGAQNNQNQQFMQQQNQQNINNNMQQMMNQNNVFAQNQTLNNTNNNNSTQQQSPQNQQSPQQNGGAFVGNNGGWNAQQQNNQQQQAQLQQNNVQNQQNVQNVQFNQTQQNGNNVLSPQQTQQNAQTQALQQAQLQQLQQQQQQQQLAAQQQAQQAQQAQQQQNNAQFQTPQNALSPQQMAIQQQQGVFSPLQQAQNVLSPQQMTQQQQGVLSPQQTAQQIQMQQQQQQNGQAQMNQNGQLQQAQPQTMQMQQNGQAQAQLAQNGQLQQAQLMQQQQMQAQAQAQAQQNGQFVQQNGLNGNQFGAQQQMNMMNGQQQMNQQPVQMNGNGTTETLNDTQQTAADASESKLNAEVAEFVPSFGGQPPQQAVQQTVQEQLFSQLQNLNTQMQAVKVQLDSVLTPQLIQVNTQILSYQQMPQLLQIPQNYMAFTQLQQSQAFLNQQILQYTLNYQELEKNLKYTQEMYQRNKDEQYKVLDDEEFERLQQQNMAMGDATDGNQTNDNENATYNLSAEVTDIGGAQLPQQNLLNVNDTQQTDQPQQIEQPQQGQQPGGIVEDVIMEDNQNENTEEFAQEINGEIDQLSNGINKMEINGDTEDHSVENNNHVDNNNVDDDNNTNDMNEPQDIRERKTMKFTDYIDKQQSTQSNKSEELPASRFNGGNGQRFGYSVTAPESPKTSSDRDDVNTDTFSESASPRKDTFLKPITSSKSYDPTMERTQSFQSNDSRFMESEENYDGFGSRSFDANDFKSNKAEINPDEIRYDIMDLIDCRKKYTDIKWSEHTIPRSVRFIGKGINPKTYMEDIDAMFKRKSSNPWLAASHTGKAPKDKKEKLTKKLTGILNKMTPEKFTKIAKQTMDIVNVFAETQDLMEIIIGLVLQFGIKQPVFGSQYAELCSHLFAHLPKLGMICEFQWVLDDPDVSTTFRKMVIQQTNDLFTTHRNHSPPDIHLDSEGKKIMDQEELDLKISKKKDNFFAVMVLVAELYNVELIKRNLVYKGVFEVLLPPKNTNLSEIDLEGLCRLLKRCGAKLDKEGSKHVDKYLQKLQSHARKYSFRTKVLVDEIKEMRGNQWKHRLKKETAKTKEEIRDEFEAEQAAKEPKNDYRGRGGHGRHKSDSRGGYDDRRGSRGGGRKGRYNDYDDDEYYVGGYDDYHNDDRDRRRGNHGYSTSNLSRGIPLKSSYKEKGHYRSGSASQSTRSLRKVGMRSNRYDEDHSWGNDSNNGRYKPKFAKAEMSPSKSFGMYQKKAAKGPRRMTRTKSDSAFSERSTESDSHSRNGSYGGGYNNGGASQSQYGDGEQKRKLTGLIDEYMASAVIDDIIDENITDFKVWAAVINDGLRDRKSSQINYFIQLIVDLFEQDVLNDRNQKFQDVILKYLTIQMDESSMDCPNFPKYIAQLFANLVFNEYLALDATFSFFTKKYKEYSEYQSLAKKKKINKVIEHSIKELDALQASQRMINAVKKFYV